MTIPEPSPVHVQAAALLRGVIYASDTEPDGSGYKMPDSVRATFEAVANGLERHGCDVRQALDLGVGKCMAADDAVCEAIRSLWILLEVERTRLRLAEESAKVWREVAERFERGELTSRPTASAACSG